MRGIAPFIRGIKPGTRGWPPFPREGWGGIDGRPFDIETENGF